MIDMTIKDIAKIAGVSHGTVSRALNDSPLISAETKKRIQRIAKENNYVVNTNAKSLKLQRSFNIGIFFSTLENGTSSSFFYSAIMGANLAVGHAYNLVVRDTGNFKTNDNVSKDQLDGILLVSQSDRDLDFIKQSISDEIPIVVINRKMDEAYASSFISDDLGGSFKAVSYIISQGHTEIAIILGEPEFKNTKIRYQGFEAAMNQASIQINQDYIMKGNYTFKSGYDAMAKILSFHKRPTAVFCLNDEMAIGAIKACLERNVKVPDEISIVGFDESEMSQYTTPALTTVARRIDKIAKDATLKLIEMIENKDGQNQVVYYETELIIRDSVKKL